MKKLLLLICFVFAASFTRAVPIDVTLSALTLSAGTLSPAFSSTTFGYTSFVTTSSITITPMASDLNATIYVNVNGGSYNRLVSGSASAPLALNGGDNTIKVEVLNEYHGGASGLIYTIHVKTPSTLDNFGLSSTTPAATAYSLRKLSTNYTGKAINVRRNADDTTLDIGFNANGGFDTVALKNFVSTGNGFVTRWYDQSGYANDAYQATTSLQPQIVNAGVVNRLNTQPAIYFGTANLATDKKVLFPEAVSMIGFAKGNGSAPSTFVSKTGFPDGFNNNIPGPFDFTNSEGYFYVGNADYSGSRFTNLSSTSQRADLISSVPSSVYSFIIFPSGTFNTYRDGVQTSTNTDATFLDRGNNMRIGNRNDNGGSGDFWTIELILFNSVLSSTDRQSIENSQISLYNSKNADLSSLSLSSGTLAPTFAVGTTVYTTSVSNATTSITVTPALADATATITVNGVANPNGNASGAIALAVGNNTITTLVTAQDGTTTKTYTITVTRAKAEQTITFPAFDVKCTTSLDFEPGASTDSGLPLTYTSSNTTVATVYQDNTDGGKWKIHIVAEGTTDIVASQAGDSDYNPSSALRELTVSSVLPITLTSYQTKIQNNSQVLLSWITSSELNNAGFEI